MGWVSMLIRIEQAELEAEQRQLKAPDQNLYRAST
jgi:hypothetical protein